MRLLRFIHEQITNPVASADTVTDQPVKKDSDGKPEPGDDKDRASATVPKNLS